MSYAILRVAKLKTIGAVAASGHHTFRERETPNADAQRTGLNVAIGTKNTADLLDAVRKQLPEKRRKDAVLCLEYLISASPDWFGDDWREKKNHGSKYFADALNWLKDKHGAENVICGNIQLDEKTPHLVVYVVPRTTDGRLSAKQFVGGRTKLSAMQTDFGKAVGQQHGLERGIEGSKANHGKVKRYYDGVNADFEPLPEVTTIVPKLRPEPEKPKMFAGKAAKVSYLQDYEAWCFERDSVEKLSQQRQTEIRVQRDTAVVTAKRHEVQALESKVLKDENKQLKQSNGALTKRVAALNVDLTKAQKVAQLFTPAEIAVAQRRAKDQEAQRVRQAEMARREQALRDAQAKIEVETAKRVQGIEKLLQRSGAVYAFGILATTALKKANGDASKVDWKAVEAQTAHAAIADGGQTPESVTEAILAHSPARSDPNSHREIKMAVQKAAPHLQARYEQKQEQEQERDQDQAPGLG